MSEPNAEDGRDTEAGEDGVTSSPVSDPEPVLRLVPEEQAVVFRVRIEDSSVFRVLQGVDEDNRIEFAVRAFKVGVLALRDSQTVGKADYVEKVFEQMQSEFKTKMEEMFGDDGVVSRRLENIFGEDGALQRELQETFGKEEGSRIWRVLNPNDSTTPLGKFRDHLEERLDPGREGSVLHSWKKDIDSRLDAFEEHFEIEKRVQEEKERGHLKGLEYQEEVAAVLDEIGQPFGDTVELVADESGRLGRDVGDIVSLLAAEHTGGLERRIVVEAKNTGVTLRGKRSIHDELQDAMENREAQFGMAVVPPSRLPDDVVPFRFYSPNRLVVAFEPGNTDGFALDAAYRVARSLVCARAGRREIELEVSEVESYLDDVRSQLENVQGIRSTLTSARKSIEDAHDRIGQMRDEIQQTVRRLEEELASTRS